jgi:hypothetical protein
VERGRADALTSGGSFVGKAQHTRCDPGLHAVAAVPCRAASWRRKFQEVGCGLVVETIEHQARSRCACCAVQGRELAREFQEVECEVKTVEAERMGVGLLSSGAWQAKGLALLQAER